MRTLKTQTGYALIIVLLTITIISIFTPLLINKLLNSTTQFQRTEEVIQLNKLTSMGEIYIEKAINKAGDQSKEEVLNWLKQIDPSKPYPTNQEISDKYYEFFISNLDNFIQNGLLISEVNLNGDKFIIEINNVYLNNSSTIDVGYTITPSLNNMNYEKYSKKGIKSLYLNISK
ncbi:hypothetical protein [Bacillus sp. S/N-304-OC-R1]|uniref:hypothetical protein n=1 Tax=Bacillus sp. S/N-304-OC-R1 TaxID=2758034 RepID=UPI001C8DE950|nr:hypothetical protein [Bacillus sp. S/N-304-OC-R1]MBY0123969.1 hypothetical protein [Bacillus sp. S/N-304-OC-R1]